MRLIVILRDYGPPVRVSFETTGSYLGEDDITRYEDIHARGQVTKG